MKSHFRLLVTAGVISAIAQTAHAQTITGQWQFDNSFNAAIGNNITNFHGTWNFASESIGGENALVAQFQRGTNVASDPFLEILHAMGANGGGSRVNRYTILMDVRFSPITGFVSLYQTNAAPNTTDGDWFIRSDRGMGISGDYTDAGNATRFNDNAWNRIALVVDTTSPAGSQANTIYRSYVNGVLQNVVASPAGWGTDARFSLNLNSFFLFADEDRETSSGAINSLQVRDFAMTGDQIAALGGPTAAGIGAVAPEPSAGLLVLLGLPALLRARRK